MEEPHHPQSAALLLHYYFLSSSFMNAFRFPVFSRVLIMRQQCKQLWIVSELDVMRVFCFGFVGFGGVFLFFF